MLTVNHSITFAGYAITVGLSNVSPCNVDVTVNRETKKLRAGSIVPINVEVDQYNLILKANDIYDAEAEFILVKINPPASKPE